MLVPGLLQGRVVAPLCQLLAQQVRIVFILKILHGLRFRLQVVQVVARLDVLVHNGLSIVELFELDHVVSHRVDGLLAQAVQTVRLSDHVDNVVLKAFLHDVPHEVEVLTTCQENVTIVPCHYPVVLLPRPVVGNLRDS